MPWGASFPPRPPPPLADGICQGRRPLAPIYSGGGEGSRTPSLWRLSPLPSHFLLLRRAPTKPCRFSCCIHHHAVVLLDLRRPLLRPCWIKKEETLLYRTCVERGGAVRSALGSSVTKNAKSTTTSSTLLRTLPHAIY